tara:strand:- start:308 stop:478 length:171 start_codon:yes stop_codon:yes gene_type:complete
MTFLSFDQHIAENGHGGASRYNVENLLEAVAKMILVDLELHGGEFGVFLDLLAMLI